MRLDITFVTKSRKISSDKTVCFISNVGNLRRR